MIQEVTQEAFPALYKNPLTAQILELIGAGGRHLSDLCRITALEDREVRKTIETIRRAGVVICANTQRGYFFPATDSELAAYIQQEERRAKSTFYTLKAARSLKKNREENQLCQSQKNTTG